jgi:hypothetical protein
MNKEQAKHLATTFQAVALAELGYFGYQSMTASHWGIFTGEKTFTLPGMGDAVENAAGRLGRRDFGPLGP